MMFRGTKARPAREYDDPITALGLSTNALTDNDLTVYPLYGPARPLPTFIEYEADRFANLEYDESAFRTEAGAILGEYLKSASNPEQKLAEKMFETAYSTHTYRHTTIGYLDDIKNMPAGYQYSRDAFRLYYTPDNATVFVVGDFDKTATLTMIQSAYGGWKGKLDAAPIPVDPKQSLAKRAHVEWNPPTLPRLWIAWHAPSANELKAAAVETLLNAYLFGPTSQLYQSLVLGKQLVDSMDAAYGDHRDPYLFGVGLRVKDAKNLKLVESAVLADVKALAGGRVDAKRMDAVRSNLRYSNIMGLDKADNLAYSLVTNTALTGDVDFLDKEFAALASVKAIDLANFAKKYLLDANRTTVTLTSGGAR